MSVQTMPGEAASDFNPMASPHREDPHLFYRAARERPVTFSPSIGAYLGVALGAVLWLSGAALACQGLRRARSARVGAEPNNVHTV